MQPNSEFNNVESLQAIIDNIPMGILVWSQEFKLVTFNAAIVEMLDIKCSDGLDYEALFLKASMVVQGCGTPARTKMRQIIKDLERDGTVVTEWLHHRADGVVIPTEVTMKFVSLAGHKVRIAYVREIDTKKYNHAREISSYLQTLYNSSFVGIGIWDNELNFVDCNPKLLKMLEIDSKQELAENFFQFSPEFQPCGTSTAELASKHSNKLYHKGIASFEWHSLTKSGKSLFFNVYAERVFYEGELVALCVVRDCTKEKTYELEAKRSAERMNFMFNNAPIGIAMFDKNIGILDANEALWKNLGYEKKEDFLKNYYNASALVQACGTPSAAKWQAFNNIAARCGFVSSEWMLKTTKGEDYPVHFTLRNMKFEGEDVTLAFVRDLREQKALLSSLTNTQEELQEARQNVK